MESGDEDDAFTMGEREWQKMNRDLSKQGFRDGKNEGRESGMQESFEKATSLGLKQALKLGQIIGVIEWKLTQTLDTTKKEKFETCRMQAMNLLDDLKNSSEPKGTTTADSIRDRCSLTSQKLVQELLTLSSDPGEISKIKIMLEEN